MKKFDLKASGQKSYYGKAVVTDWGKNYSVLTSYQTDVAAVKNGRAVRFWGGYSVTTMKHVNDFFRMYGLPALNKKEWLAMPVEAPRFMDPLVYLEV